jgi:hypothetical protein
VATLLDNGNRTNETPLNNGGAWKGPVFNGDKQVALASERFANSENAWSNSYWATKFPANQVVRITVAASVASRTFELTARIQNPGLSTLNCYYLAVTTAGGWELGSVKAGVEATVGTGTKTIAVGDKLWLECNGTAIKCIHETSGGVKTTVIEKTNSTVAGEGFIGHAGSGTGIAWDDFYGGAIEEAGTKVTLGQSTETDSPRPLGVVKTIRKTLTPAAETGSAQTLSRSKRVTLGTAAEVDGARVLARAKRVAFVPAGESGSAVARPALKRISPGIAAGSDAAVGLARAKQVGLLSAAEADSVLLIRVTRHVALAPAGEVDSAVGIMVLKTIHVAFSPATEAGDAVSARLSKRLALSFAIEADVGVAFAIRHRVGLLPATEVDAAKGVAALRQIALGAAAETDAARSLAWTHFALFLPAEEGGQAQELSHRNLFGPISFIPAGEIDHAAVLAFHKPIYLGLLPAGETDAALGPHHLKPIRATLLPALEIEAAMAIVLRAQPITFTPGHEIDLALALLLSNSLGSAIVADRLFGSGSTTVRAIGAAASSDRPLSRVSMS